MAKPVPEASSHEDAAEASGDPGIPDVSEAASFRDELVACYHRLVEEAHSEEVRVDAFCRSFLAGQEGDRERRDTAQDAAFLTALLETFEVQIRQGRSYLRPSSSREIPEAIARTRACRDTERARQRAIYKRLLKHRLPNEADLAVRVTECTREGQFIKIRFHLKLHEAKLTEIITGLNSADLGGPIKCVKGLVCAAPWQEEIAEEGRFENYARAVILNTGRRKGSGVWVRFLDFGPIRRVERTSIRKLPREYLQTPALAHSAVVVNTITNDPSERERQAYTMWESEQTIVRTLKYNKERKFYEVYVYRPNLGPVVEDLGFRRG